MWRVRAIDRDGHEVARFQLEKDGELTIGRDADRQLVLPSASVSRRHARLVIEGGRATLHDEGSANGVLVNNVRVNGSMQVNSTSQISIADFMLTVERVGATAEAPRAQIPGAGEEPAIRLVADGGPYDGRVFEVPPGEVTVGRAADNELVFDDPSLSRKHAKLRRQGGNLEVEDLNSSNGTLVNGRKLMRGVVRAGDILRFGELHFRVEGGGGGTRTVAPTASPTMGYLLLGGAGVTFVVAVLAVIAGFHKVPPVQASGREGIAKIAKQADQHFKAAQNFYQQQRYDSARTEVDLALEGDPANVEGRSLRLKIIKAPEDDRTVASAKGSLALGDRKGIEAALRGLEDVTPGSLAHNLLAGKLVSALERYGNERCQSRAYGDCAWALCRAYEVAPAGERPSPRSQKALEEAEKKLRAGRDPTFVPCRFAAK